MNRLFFSLLLMLFATGISAQNNLVVKEFKYVERDFTANSGSTIVLDVNDEPCALIKVRTDQHGFTFDPGRLFPVEKTEEQCSSHPLEIYVWVQSGVKRMSIGHPVLGRIYDYDFGTTLQAGKTYVMELVTGRVNVKVEEIPTQQYVVFQLSPANAVVKLGGQMLKTEDGTAMKLMNFGTYQYSVDAPDYQQEVGRIEVNDPQNKHIIRVQLKPNFTQVTLKAPDNAEIWVNGEKKGVGQWTGNLGAGAYKFEAKKAGHHNSQRSFTLDAEAGPQTIQLEAPTLIVGKADISSTPALADLYIDGQKMGQTPQRLADLAAGRHSLRLIREGYLPYESSFEIKEDSTTNVSAVMKKDDTPKFTTGSKPLPEWFETENESGWIGISPPMADTKEARGVALISAALAYLRSEREGEMQSVAYSMTNISNKQISSQEAISLEDINLKNSSSVIYKGFSCDVIKEYKNNRGEYFVSCRFAKTNDKNALKIIQHYEMEAKAENNNSTEGYKTDVTALMLLNNQGYKCTLNCSSDKEGKSVCTLYLDNDVVPAAKQLTYSKTKSITAANGYSTLRFNADETGQSLGLMRIAALCNMPFVSSQANVRSLSEFTSKDGEATINFISAMKIDSCSCQPYPIRLGTLTTKECGMLISDVNFKMDSQIYDSDNYLHEKFFPNDYKNGGLYRLLAMVNNYYYSILQLSTKLANKKGTDVNSTMSRTDIGSEESRSTNKNELKLKNIGVHWDFENVPSEKDMEKAFSNATKNGLPQPIFGTWVRADYE